MFIPAEQARQISDATHNVEVQRMRKDIEEEIHKAMNVGLFRIAYYGLPLEIKNELLKLGYFIWTDPCNHSKCLIAWKEGQI